MIYAIVVVIILVIALAGGALWYFFKSSFAEFAVHGFRVYNFNAEQGVFREFTQPSSKTKISKSKFYRRTLPIIKDWTSISQLSEFLKLSEGEKVLRQALHDITKGPDHLNTHFVSSLPGFKSKVFLKNKFDVFLNFQKVEDKKYVIEFRWTMQTRQGPVDVNHIKEINREELSKSEIGATAYVAFNVNDSQQARSLFLKLVASSWRDHLVYFLDGSMIFFVFQKPTVARSQREVESFIKRLRRTGFELRARPLYTGSAYVNSVNAHLPKNQTNALQILEYLISVSIETGKEFVSINSTKVDVNNHKSYYEGLKIFRNAIKEKTFDIEHKSVRKFPEHHPFMDIVFPNIHALNKKLFEKIISNSNYYSQLVDALAGRVAGETDIKKVFLDVNLDWMHVNFSNLRNKSVIYIIAINAYDDQSTLASVVKRLEEANYEYGFRIVYYDDEVGNRISEFAPRFIVVDHALIGEDSLFSSYEFISLLSLADYAESKNSSLIYQKLPNYVNESIAKRIAIKYYY